jgi:hypothetical protein
LGEIGSGSDLSFLGVVGVSSDGRLGGILVGVMKIEKEKRVNKYRRPACMGNGIRDNHINLFQPPKVRVRARPTQQVVKVTHPLPALSSDSDLEINHSHSY